MNKKNIYLVGAECGSGKTTAIMKKLIPYAKKNDRKVLFLCNRKALFNQLSYKYKFQKKYNELIEKNLNLTLKMYQGINELVEMDLVEQIIGSDFYYVVIDEAHLIYDASDYDFKAHRFIKYINEYVTNSIIIALSGTPDSVLKIGHYFKREIIKMREVDKTNNKIRRIILTPHIHPFIATINAYLSKQYKVLCLVSYGEKLEWGKSIFKERDIGTFISDSNEKVEKYMEEKDKYILEEIIKREEMVCEVIFTTKFLDVGISINAHQSFLVSYYSNEMMNTIEQFRSRIRFMEESKYHVDMLFKVMTKQSSLSKINNIKQYLQRYEEVYKTYGTFENILKNNPKQKFKTTFGNPKVEDYEQYNEITKQLKLEQLAFYKELYYAEDLLQTYKQKLELMYPYTEVITLQDLKVETYLDELLGEKNELSFKGESERICFREQMKDFGVVTAHKKIFPHLQLLTM